MVKRCTKCNFIDFFFFSKRYENWLFERLLSLQSWAYSAVSGSTDLCCKHVPSDLQEVLEAVKLHSSPCIYWNKRDWSITVCNMSDIIQSRHHLGQEE